MQFKTREPKKRMDKERVQLWVYDGFDAENRRAKTKMIGSFDAIAGPTADLLASLTEEQRAEVDQWMAKRKAEQQRLRKQGFIDYCAARMKNTALAIPDGQTTLTADQAAEIWEQMAVLAKSLRKAGFPKPAKAAQKSAKATPTIDPLQTALDV